MMMRDYLLIGLTPWLLGNRILAVDRLSIIKVIVAVQICPVKSIKKAVIFRLPFVFVIAGLTVYCLGIV